jgi:hypothetical protein
MAIADHLLVSIHPPPGRADTSSLLRKTASPGKTAIEKSLPI